MANHRCKEFLKKGLRHYELLGGLFNVNTTIGLLQILSAQPAPNSSEKQELDAAFLSSEVHVNVDTDSVDDVEELPTPDKGQSWRQPEKRATEQAHSSGKKKKEGSFETMTEAIWGFTEIRNRRLNKSTDSMP
ncbi:hypothetical protein CFP56_024837 [Quercus suber]|uniref:Uncharacterized protein n=1 Tax=Quercus suber TaxID=58331 RepID=A0AAW0K691_QUESU